ncbi:PAS domain S-box protein [Leptolyngbya sp. FACHB-36]|uniref:hybrid sensor histidine kinase/response regulator n=1 Tax=Leptolyngbya sp. FACHB-36 TaxID=2692808 RepID=UPI0018EF6391|nr:PAS domain S-box protein [Leptolyngbya sp. FACHB-36]
MPYNEVERLDALRQYQVLDTPPEATFDDLTTLAAHICQTPIALISLVDHDRQWFKAKLGVTVSETSRDLAFCAHTILQSAPLVVSDTLTDERFAANPLVTEDPHIRFYAGAPLITPHGHQIGTLCVIDRVPRQLTAEQLAALQALSRQAVSQLELRRSLVEQQRAEHALREREMRLRAIIDAEPECVKLVSAEGILLDMNAAGLAMIEVDSFSAVQGQSVYPLIASEYQAAYKAFNEKVCQGSKGTLEFQILGCRGTRRWVETHAVPLWNEATRSCVQLAITRDITKRKQAAALLQTTQARLQHLLNSSPIVIFSCEPTGDFQTTFVSENVTTLFGYTSQQFVNEPAFWRNRVHPEDALDILAQLATIVDRGQHRCEYRFLHQDGTYHWTASEVRLVQDDAGSIIELVGNWQDITERKQAEERIREQAMLLDKAQDAIAVINTSDRVLFWNQSAERLLGWTATEAIGRDAWQFLFEQSDELDRAYTTVRAIGEWHGELKLVTKAAKTVLVESRWTLVRNSRDPEAILIINTDITEKKQLERQFLRAQRLESIGTLAGGIAHDLNNVLTPMLLAVQLLQMKFADEQSGQWLEILENNIKRGANLVKQVLSFARGVEGERVILEIKHLIREIKQIVKETFPKFIELQTDLATDLWTLRGDATQLHQVLMNLCVNARDAMSDGGVLRIAAANLIIDEGYARMHLDATTGPYVVITVSDTGSGIPPDVVDRIFEPFFTTKALGEGTGLGLSTVMGIVRSHGGFVHVSSTIGKGTEFKVFLPAEPTTMTLAAQDTPLARGHGETILVVDDEAAIREIAQKSLEAYGYQVLTAKDGIEAIALYVQHKQQISLVLVDMMMPVMDGPTTIRTLHKLNPSIKIVAVSGLMTNDKLSASIAPKIRAFLSKPFTTPDLLKTLDQVLNDEKPLPPTQSAVSKFIYL